jgi:hypothetical protein
MDKNKIVKSNGGFPPIKIIQDKIDSIPKEKGFIPTNLNIIDILRIKKTTQELPKQTINIIDSL